MEKNSHEWYEKVYHAAKNMPPFKEYIQSAVDRGYKKRFDEMFAEASKQLGHVGIALEIGGHLGKTAHWLIESLPGFYLDIMDFSAPAVEYLKKNLGDKAASIFKGSVDKISAHDSHYDLITCIDVAEHLAEDVYRDMLCEISRLLKPTGHCIFYGSMSTHNTHINIRNPETIIKDCEGLLKFVKMLPHNHILFRGKP